MYRASVEDEVGNRREVRIGVSAKKLAERLAKRHCEQHDLRLLKVWLEEHGPGWLPPK